MIVNHNRTQTATISLLIMKAGFIGAVVMSILLIARFALKMLAISAGDVTSLIFNTTEMIVRPFEVFISPLTFSSGATVELGSLLPAVVFVMMSGIFLWRLYLTTCEPLHVRCVHVTPG